MSDSFVRGLSRTGSKFKWEEEVQRLFLFLDGRREDGGQ